MNEEWSSFFHSSQAYNFFIVLKSSKKFVNFSRLLINNVTLFAVELCCSSVSRRFKLNLKTSPTSESTSAVSNSSSSSRGSFSCAVPGLFVELVQGSSSSSSGSSAFSWFTEQDVVGNICAVPACGELVEGSSSSSSGSSAFSWFTEQDVVGNICAVPASGELVDFFWLVEVDWANKTPGSQLRPCLNTTCLY